MEIFFWGVRGSIASPGPATAKYGGNTTCVEIRDGDDYVIIDAGTGIRECGNFILKERGPKNNIHMLITHTHWDHIQGFPFFVPIFIPGNFLDIVGPAQYNASFEEIMKNQMQYNYFPVEHHQLAAEIQHRDVFEETFILNGFTITAKCTNHPVRTLAYRFEKNGKSIVFLTDSEPYYDMVYHGIQPDDEDDIAEFLEVQKTIEEENQKNIDFCNDADVLVIDAQYTLEEYPKMIGFGHTPMETAVEIGKKANVKKLVFFHHDPGRSDADLDMHQERFQKQLSNEKGHSITDLIIAQERTSVEA
jgi:phosphoribosyl 1,2-cyclic phosphodiesterase